MELTPKELLIIKKAYSVFKKQYEEPVKTNIKKLISETKAIKTDTLSKAYDLVKNEMLVDNGDLMLLNIQNVIHPVRKKEKFELIEDYKFIQEFGEKKYKLIGSYELLSQNDILKNLNISAKKLSSKEKTQYIYDNLPYRLQAITQIICNNYFSAKKIKIENKEINKTLSKYKIVQKIKKLIEMLNKNEFDYKLFQDIKENFRNIIVIGENYYLNEKNKNNKEVLEYFNYIESYKLKLNINIDEAKDNEFSFLKFKVSSKKLKDFIISNNLERLELFGIEKRTIIDIFAPINSFDELKKLSESLKSSYIKTSDSFTNYLKNINITQSSNIKKVIRKF